MGAGIKCLLVHAILASLVLSLLLLGCGQSPPEATSEPAAPAGDERVEDLPLPPPLKKGNPKLSSQLWDLIEAESQGEAELLASRRHIKLEDGGVKVIIECLPGQVAAAASAAASFCSSIGAGTSAI